MATYPEYSDWMPESLVCARDNLAAGFLPIILPTTSADGDPLLHVTGLQMTPAQHQMAYSDSLFARNVMACVACINCRIQKRIPTPTTYGELT